MNVGALNPTLYERTVGKGHGETLDAVMGRSDSADSTGKGPRECALVQIPAFR